MKLSKASPDGPEEPEEPEIPEEPEDPEDSEILGVSEKLQKELDYERQSDTKA